MNEDSSNSKKADYPRATSPGAVHVGKDQAALLDQRIAEKRAAAAAAAQQSINPCSSNYSTAGSSASDSDEDQPMESPTQQTTKPGAVAELNSLQDAVSTKIQQGNASAQQVGARAQLSSLEDAVSAKVLSGSSGAGTARTQLSLEDAVTAKVRSENHSNNVSPTSLSQMEADLLSKQIARSAPSQVDQRTQLASLEDAVTAKIITEERRNVSSSLHQLEQDLVSKENARTSARGASNDLASLEASVTAKVKEEFSQQNDVASSLHALEQDVVSKENSRAALALSELDQRIAAKQSMQSEKDSTKKTPSDVAEPPKFDPEGTTFKHYDEENRAPNESIMDVSAPEITTADRGIETQPGLEFGQLSNSNLAVAIAVNEEEDDDMKASGGYVVEAVEYDPDAKPNTKSLYKTRRFRLYVGLAVFTVTMLIIAVALGVTLSGRDDSGDDSTDQETRAVIEQVVGPEVLQSTTSPYSKALDWIVNGDPMQLGPDSPNLVQRYIAAYLYFATSTEEKPWRSCNPPADAWNDPPGCVFLAIENDLAFDQHTFYEVPAVAWLSNSPECSWSGMRCDSQGQVRSIEMIAQSLSGTFPEGLVHLPFLQQIHVRMSFLTGPIPDEIGAMDHLSSFDLFKNDLTSIPQSLWSASNLQWLQLGFNSVEGTVPTDVGNLVDLKGLLLGNNALNGVIPGEMGLLDSLAHFYFHANDFEGKIPKFIQNWNSISDIWLHNNKLTGPIPSWIGMLNGTLDDLKLSSNSLSGPLPSGLYSLSKMTTLDLSSNSLSGVISSDIGFLSDLNEFYLQNNKFSGAVPPELSKMTYISKVDLHGNDFTGTMPNAFCSIKGGVILTELSADCTADETTGLAEIECDNDCCTTCCKGDGTDCRLTANN